MQKILITGAAGFVPSSLADALISTNKYYIVGVDNLLTGNLKNLPSDTIPNYKFIKADVNEYNSLSSIMLSYQFDYVFHYAAVVGVTRTQENPVMVLNDIEGIKHILELSKNTGVKRIFFSSSSEVYGEPVELPQNEHTTPLNSRVPYAIVKNVGEAFFKSYHQNFGLDYTIFRFFNTYGPKQSPDFVMSKFIKSALKGKDITIYGDGSQTRTFCYIQDNIEACMNAFQQNKFVNDVLNIGNENEITILELAKLVISITKSDSKIIHLDPLIDGDMTRRRPDIGKMKTLLNRSLISMEEGIHHVLNSKEFHNLNQIKLSYHA